MDGVDIAELAVKISEGALYPNFGLTASVTKSYDTIPQILKQTNVSILGQITVPVYQGGAEHSAIRQSKETVGQQRLNLDVNRDQARETVVQSRGQSDAARAQMRPERFRASSHNERENLVSKGSVIGGSANVALMAAPKRPPKWPSHRI
jgi:outer membrane protein